VSQPRSEDDITPINPVIAIVLRIAFDERAPILCPNFIN